MIDHGQPSETPVTAEAQDPIHGILPAVSRALWSSRFVVALAVVGSTIASLAVFYLATTDTIYMVGHLRAYTDPALDVAARKALHAETVVHVVEIVDGYLLATILLIFALGLYELFVAPLEGARTSRTGASALLVRDLDDLKNRLGKVVLIIMIVTFFEEVVTVSARSALELLWVAGGIALVGATLWLTHSDAKRR